MPPRKKAAESSAPSSGWPALQGSARHDAPAPRSARATSSAHVCSCPSLRDGVGIHDGDDAPADDDRDREAHSILGAAFRTRARCLRSGRRAWSRPARRRPQVRSRPHSASAKSIDFGCESRGPNPDIRQPWMRSLRRTTTAARAASRAAASASASSTSLKDVAPSSPRTLSSRRLTPAISISRSLTRAAATARSRSSAALASIVARTRASASATRVWAACSASSRIWTFAARMASSRSAAASGGPAERAELRPDRRWTEYDLRTTCHVSTRSGPLGTQAAAGMRAIVRTVGHYGKPRHSSQGSIAVKRLPTNHLTGPQSRRSFRICSSCECASWR